MEPMRGDESLRAAAARGRAAWPGVVLDERVWLETLTRVRDHADADKREQIDVAGLYLATACLERVPGAVEAFEREAIPVARRAVASRAGGARVDEILQRVRLRLLAPIDGGAPKLALYAGRGPLGGFVRTVAIRLLLDDDPLARATESDDVLAAIPEAADVEAQLCRLDQQQHFRDAFREALSALAPRDRALLRLSLLDGLSIDDIAPMYDAHRATVARWLSAARETLAARTREVLCERLRLAAPELESLLGRVLSHFELSLSRLLRDDPR
jgi:RNA polymerase sigma-70 factor (ECF subfamily)